jgi:hypothetical protein
MGLTPMTSESIKALYAKAGVALQERGNRYFATCPFHVESAPSFVVYPDGSYHCFGCGAHGTAKEIAHRYNVDMVIIPDVNFTKDPVVTKLEIIKTKLENDLALAIVDQPQNEVFRAYDSFDRLVQDANLRALDVDTSVADITEFLIHGFSQISRRLVG